MQIMERTPPRIVPGRSFTHFNEKSSKQDPDYCYSAWSKIFGNICEGHAPYRKIKIGSLPFPNWISPQIKHNTYLKVKKSGDVALW